MKYNILTILITVLSVHTSYAQFDINGIRFEPYELLSGKAAEIEFTPYELKPAKDTFVIRYKYFAVKAYFNNNDMLIKEVINDATSSIKTTLKEYEGTVLKKEFRLANTDLYETILYDYTSTNKKKSALAVDGQGEKSYIKSYTYKGDTVMIEETFYYARNITTKEEFHYNKKNKLTKHCNYNSKGVNTKCETFAYDNNDRLIAETFSLDREHGLELAHQKEYYYKDNYVIRGEFNNLILEKKAQLIYKYNFDPKGNWTSIVYYVNGVPAYYVTRKITYR